MRKLSLPQIESYVANLVATGKISIASYEDTFNNTVGLLDKIGAIVNIDGVFTDKLPELDGAFLPRGKQIEEFHEDLIMPEDFDRDGSGYAKYADGSYRPVYYSYPIKKQKVKISILGDDIEGAVNTAEEFARIIALKNKKLYDSEAILKYTLKRELIGHVIDKIEEELSDDNPVFTVGTAYDVDDCVIDDDEATTIRHGIVVKAISTTEDIDDWDDAVEKGFIVELKLREVLAKPVDTSTGEAFVESVKNVVEEGDDVSEGNSLSGNTLGSSNSMAMYVTHGVMSNLDVKTMAGAFQASKIALPIENVKVIKDFGKGRSNYYAFICDTRGIKLHPNYRRLKKDDIGENDFVNLILHLGFTPYFSRNVFFHVYKEPSLTTKRTREKKTEESK